MASTFDLIAFDGDDTLWHNERSYRDGRERFRQLLARTGVELDADALEAAVNRTELENLDYFGYGVSSFALSLIETAVDLTEGRIRGGDLREVTRLAKDMISEGVELFDGVRDVVADLAASHALILITKGDLLHQTSKLERSGLSVSFLAVEVVSRKTPAVHASLLAGHGVDPNRFLMIGNSIRSDVLPVVEIGSWAIHVPAALSWSHEDADVPAHARCRIVEVASVSGIRRALETLEHQRDDARQDRLRESFSG